MATSTPNYGLKKFESGDAPDLPSLSASMDKIDTELKKNAGAAATNATNIGLLAKAHRITDPTTADWRVALQNHFGGVPTNTAVLIQINTTSEAVSVIGIKSGSSNGKFFGVSVIQGFVKCTNTNGSWAFTAI